MKHRSRHVSKRIWYYFYCMFRPCELPGDLPLSSLCISTPPRFKFDNKFPDCQPQLRTLSGWSRMRLKKLRIVATLSSLEADVIMPFDWVVEDSQ